MQIQMHVHKYYHKETNRSSSITNSFFYFKTIRSFTIAFIFISFITMCSAGWVRHTCSKCSTIACPSNFCYNLSGSGYPKDQTQTEFQICSQTNCMDEQPFGKFGTQCQIDSSKSKCSSKCCVKQRLSSSIQYCADNFPDGNRFCSDNIRSQIAAGIIAAGIMGASILACICAFICTKCCKCINSSRKKSKKQMRENVPPSTDPSSDSRSLRSGQSGQSRPVESRSADSRSMRSGSDGNQTKRLNGRRPQAQIIIKADNVIGSQTRIRCEQI